MEVCFFIQKTSRFAGGFNFVRRDLKHSVKVGTIFLRLRRHCFSFGWDFWRRRKCPRRLLHEGALSGPKQSPQKCLTGFWYLTGPLLETKKLLTTDISNSMFISSSRWGAIIFPLERSRPIRSNQYKQCAVHHGKCQWILKCGPQNWPIAARVLTEGYNKVIMLLTFILDALSWANLSLRNDKNIYARKLIYKYDCNDGIVF